MRNIPMWIQRAIGIFVLLFIFLILGDDNLLGYTGFEWQYDKERYIKTTVVLALIALTVSWLRRK